MSKLGRNFDIRFLFNSSKLKYGQNFDPTDFFFPLLLVKSKFVRNFVDLPLLYLQNFKISPSPFCPREVPSYITGRSVVKVVKRIVLWGGGEADASKIFFMII